MQEEQKTLWGSHLIQTPAQQNILFCAGRDVQELPMADIQLLEFDIWTNRAHCIMLERCRMIEKDHLRSILEGLKQLEKAIEMNEFRLNPELEDVHTNVEMFVSELQGSENGGRMHIGRSRNDQSACDMRLYLRSRSLFLFEEVKKLVELSQLMAEAMPEYAKKLPKKELPNFMVKLISYLDSSAKTMIPDLGIVMQTDTTYAEELLGFKFKPAKGCISENAKSVVRLGLV